MNYIKIISSYDLIKPHWSPLEDAKELTHCFLKLIKVKLKHINSFLIQTVYQGNQVIDEGKFLFIKYLF